MALAHWHSEGAEGRKGRRASGLLGPAGETRGAVSVLMIDGGVVVIAARRGQIELAAHFGVMAQR
ncbi:MAG TPA: hypothetical protein DCL54_07200 [Alphaproteobacteria bacterium]|nr:hypothetical protein [Alphaproteobacteria bacterium]HAJ46349.1 hypothetical protein [Alphaproteobacteria bacterium]